MNLFTRQNVCSHLALSQWQSYAIFPATKTGLIREADVLAVLNGKANAMPRIAYMPQLLTGEEMERLTSVPEKKLARFSRRKRDPLPHIRFNSHVIRYSKPEALAWLEEYSH